jgi:hypothetical protein
MKKKKKIREKMCLPNFSQKRKIAQHFLCAVRQDVECHLFILNNLRLTDVN